MPLIAIDTMTLIYAQTAAPSSAAADVCRRAKLLFWGLQQDRGTTIVFPTVAASEFLAGIPEAGHAKTLAQLAATFMLAPFDAKAAALAAALWRKHRELPRENQIARNVLKADVLIVASAKAAGATAFYSHDAGCRQLAALAKMDALDLPTHVEDLYAEGDLAKQGGPPPPLAERKPRAAPPKRAETKRKGRK